MITTIEVTHDTLHILTGIGAAKYTCDINRQPASETWQWHEVVADAISNHHASMMGKAYPCPTVPPKPDWLPSNEELDEIEAMDGPIPCPEPQEVANVPMTDEEMRIMESEAAAYHHDDLIPDFPIPHHWDGPELS